MRGCIDGCKYDGRNTFECSYCGEEHCSTHRLPEKHNCIALATADTLGPEFRDFSTVSEGDIVENNGKKNQPTENTCPDCGSSVNRGFDFCANCREKRGILSPDAADSSDENMCMDCSAVIPSDKERCLDCRREKALMDSKSPDVSPTGDLVVEDDHIDFNGSHSRTDTQSVIGRVKTKLTVPKGSTIQLLQSIVIVLLVLIVLALVL